MTWNVDGLCSEATQDRTHKSLQIILSQAPDLLFLQEVSLKDNAVVILITLLFKVIYSFNLNKSFYIYTGMLFCCVIVSGDSFHRKNIFKRPASKGI